MSAPNDPQKKPVDLSDLQSLNFGPSWATSNTPRPPSAPREHRDHDDRRDNRGGGRGFGDRRPDRRGFGGGQQRQGGQGRDNRQETGERRSEGGRRFGNERPGREQYSERREGRGPRQNSFDDFQNRSRYPVPRFNPAAEVLFYPEDKPFAVLIKAVKASMRTYELFEIAHLILEKNDRFTVVCRPLGNETDKDIRLYQSVPDYLPFLSEGDAIAHVMQKHLDRFFTTEEVEIDPPKGNFLMVSKCGFTGEILGPPNYHGYQQILREHYAARLSRMPYDKFASRIESVRDQALVDQWIENMKKVTRYTFKDPKEGEPASFDSLDAARNFLLTHRKDQVVRVCEQVRFPGRLIGTMPNGPLRDTVERELAFQRQFPLSTSNSLRGRLRKAGFTMHKRGGKGITFVSAVRRKFRTTQTVFADGIQKVVDFIERNPNVKVSELPDKFLGISPIPAPVEASAPETAKPEGETNESKPEVTAPVPAQSEPVETVETPQTVSTDAEAVPAEPPVAPSDSEQAVPKAEEAAPAEATPAPEKPATAPKPKPSGEAASAAAPAIDLSNPAIRELLNTVRWLVSEGYVTEFSDGRLFAAPVMTAAQAKIAAEEESRSRHPKEGSAPAEDHPESDILPMEDIPPSDSDPV